jgi:hypothetical protein
MHANKPFLGKKAWKIFFKPGNVWTKISGLKGGYLIHAWPSKYFSNHVLGNTVFLH